jgi:ribosomal protein L11 methyltransferase
MATRVKQAKPLYQLVVTVPAETEDAASAILENHFATWPISYSKAESQRTELSLYLADDQKPTRNQLSELRTSLGGLAEFGISTIGISVRIDRLANRNWKESWKRHFQPIEIGRRLLLRPRWSRRKARSGQAVVVLDPGLSFGTGQHPTTSFCLQELARASAPRSGQSFLDIGTGSGILAIAAAKLRYDPIRAFDSDSESIRVATANARRNRVQNKVAFHQADLTRLPLRSRTRYDLVCANLLADLICSEKLRIINRVKPGAVLVIAGILLREFDEVEKHFTALGARPLRHRILGDWKSGSYRIPV